jgi:hypothetical protein
MNPIEWLLYAAADDLYHSADAKWLALPLQTRSACSWVAVAGHRQVTPYPDVRRLIDALQCKSP